MRKAYWVLNCRVIHFLIGDELAAVCSRFIYGRIKQTKKQNESKFVSNPGRKHTGEKETAVCRLAVLAYNQEKVFKVEKKHTETDQI